MKKKFISVITILCIIFTFSACSSSDGDSLYKDGQKAYMNGDYDAALSYFEDAIKKGVSENVSTSDLYAFLGNTYMELDDIDKAIESYDISLEADSSNVRNYVNLAIAYRQKGDGNKAKQLYVQATAIDPDYPELNSSLGSPYLLEGDAEKAIEYFNKAIEKDPDLAVAWGNAALAYAKTDDFEKANEYLNTAREKGYKNADTIAEMIEEEKQ